MVRYNQDQKKKIEKPTFDGDGPVLKHIILRYCDQTIQIIYQIVHSQ